MTTNDSVDLTSEFNMVFGNGESTRAFTWENSPRVDSHPELKLRKSSFVYMNIFDLRRVWYDVAAAVVNEGESFTQIKPK